MSVQETGTIRGARPDGKQLLPSHTEAVRLGLAPKQIERDRIYQYRCSEKIPLVCSCASRFSDCACSCPLP